MIIDFHCHLTPYTLNEKVYVRKSVETVAARPADIRRIVYAR